MGETGPCGRCSEIHYFRGNHLPCARPVCLGVACDCDRYVEIWNNVFMEFDRQPDGTLNPLPAPSIDTGMGLERITAVLQGVLSNYDTDLFTPLLRAIGEHCRHDATAAAMSPTDVSMRVVADHARAMTFLHRRRRRAVQRVARLRAAQDHAARDAPREAARHRRAVPPPPRRRARPRDGRGLPGTRLAPRLRRAPDPHRGGAVRVGADQRPAAARGGARPRGGRRHACSAGDEAFRLYDTFGVPRDFIEDMAEQRQVAFDARGFERGDGGPEGEGAGGQRVRRRGHRVGGRSRRPPRRCAARPTASRATPPRGWTGATVLALLDEEGQPVDVLAEGAVGLRRARPHAVLRRIGRPGVGHRHARRATRATLARRRRAGEGGRRPAAPPPRPRRRRGELQRARHRHGRGGRRGARRDAPQPHRHPPAARGAAPGARLARQAGRLARLARPAAVRLRPLRGR